MIKLTIPKTAVSWNKYYAGLHWTQRKKITDEWQKEMKVALYRAKVPRQPLEQRAVILIKARMKKPIDPDNICAKLIIDPLVKWGIIKNDSYAYVAQVILSVAKIDKADTITKQGTIKVNDYIELTIDTEFGSL